MGLLQVRTTAVHTDCGGCFANETRAEFGVR